MKTMMIAITLAALAVSVQVADAQELNLRADRKITGQYYLPYSAKTYSRHVINQAQVLPYYGKTYATVPAETAKAHAVEVRRNVDAFGKELAKMEVEYKNDPEAMKLISEIRLHHKEASEHCGMLEAECAKHAPQGGTVMSCCADMLKHLQAADTAHEKLLKYLKIPALPEANQPTK